MRGRKLAERLAILGLALSLIGAGLFASFSDRGTAQQDADVGTFGIELSSQTSGAVVSADKKSITYTTPTIMASAPNESPLAFTVKSTGSIPALIRLTQSGSALDAPFSSTLGTGPNPVEDFTLHQGDTRAFNAGIAWSELQNPDLGKAVSLTYTIDATEVASGPALPPIGTFSRVGDVITIRVNSVPGTWGPYTILPGDTLSLYDFSAVWGTPAWHDNLATADADGVIYYTGTLPKLGSPVGNWQVTVKHNGSIAQSFPTRL
jgi:predicted ribosomally synthesized peptide with SipW-like signal peptide